MLKLYPNRTAAILAAEQDAKRRGYSDETAKKYCTAFATLERGCPHCQWEAWTIHHIVADTNERRIVRRPLT